MTVMLDSGSFAYRGCVRLSQVGFGPFAVICVV